MKINIDFGFAEWSLISGVALYLNSEIALGVSLCAIAVIAATLRSAVRFQNQQQEAEDRKKLHMDFNDAGIGLAGAINELFVSPDRKKTVH